MRNIRLDVARNRIFVYKLIPPLAIYQDYRDETSTLGRKVKCAVIQHLIVKITHVIP